MISFLYSLGQASIPSFWLPIGFWTLIATILYFIAKKSVSRSPLLSYRIHFALLVSLPVGLLLMPFLATQVINQPFSITVFANMDVLFDRLVFAGNSSEFSDMPADQIAAISESTKEPLQWGMYSFVGLLTVFWVFASSYSLVQLAGRWLALLSAWKERDACTESTVLSVVNTLRAEIGIKRKVNVMTGPAHIVPFTFGWRRPTLVIPSNLAQNPQQLRVTLYHELVHVKRNDFAMGMVAHFVRALFVFHPLVHVLEKEVRAYRELSCDSVLLDRAIVSASDYARLLLLFNEPVNRQYAISMVSKKSLLKQRVEAMQNYRNEQGIFSKLSRSMALLIVMIVPAIIMACSFDTQRHTESVDLSQESGAFLSAEMGMSFNLPTAWSGSELVRFTQSSYKDSLPFSPPPSRFVFDDNNPDRLVRGQLFYLNTDVTQENVGEVIAGTRAFHRYDLTITYYGNKSRKERRLWRDGKCPYADTDVLCEVRFQSPRQLVRKLRDFELPFDADAGYVFKNKFQYGNQAHLNAPQLEYHFYVVRGARSYHIKLQGVATTPDRVNDVVDVRFLNEASVGPALSSIKFF